MTPQFLLISDLDDTLLGDEGALESFAAWCRDLESPPAFVYASGRFYETIEKDIATTALLDPVAVIGGVGSEIRSYPSGELDAAWSEQISRNWSADLVRKILAADTRLELQPASSQSDTKVSYFFPDATQADLAALQERLHGQGVRVSWIYSSRRDLDFLPEGVDKGAAATFVARQLGFPSSRVIVAGNSGNDSRLFEHDFLGIVVANAHEELKRYASDPRVFASQHPRAAGVQEGLAHWIRTAPNAEGTRL